MSARYIHDRKLPDKAIDVIDETGASQMLVAEAKRKKTIGVKEIEATVASMARIPPKAVSKDDTEVLQHLEETLKRVVYGQDEAITALASAIKLARAGLRDPEKPIGCYLFSGPTGVGKTEAARQLASSLGLELIRFDMSEYMERHTVSRLIGAPPGYVGFDQGGLLTDAIDQHPHSVLLLDEIEKAHPDLFNILLQVMDHGKLTDHSGKQIDFRNVILIMTTNAGAADMAREAFGFHRNEARGRRRGGDQQAVHARSSATGSTRSCRSRACRWKSSRASSTSSSCSSRRSSPTATCRSNSPTRRAPGWSTNGYDESMGARPMARVIQTQIKTPLADEVLFGKLKNGGVVRVVVTADDAGVKKLSFVYPEGPAQPRPERGHPGRGPGARRGAQGEGEEARGRPSDSDDGEAKTTPESQAT